MRLLTDGRPDNPQFNMCSLRWVTCVSHVCTRCMQWWKGRAMWNALSRHIDQDRMFGMSVGDYRIIIYLVEYVSQVCLVGVCHLLYGIEIFPSSGASSKSQKHANKSRQCTHARSYARNHSYTHTSMHKRTQTNTHRHTRTHACARTHDRTNTHTHTHTHARAHTHTHTHTHTRTHARTHARTHTHALF